MERTPCIVQCISKFILEWDIELVHARLIKFIKIFILLYCKIVLPVTNSTWKENQQIKIFLRIEGFVFLYYCIYNQWVKRTSMSQYINISRSILLQESTDTDQQMANVYTHSVLPCLITRLHWIPFYPGILFLMLSFSKI